MLGGLCYTSCGALAWTRNSSMGPPWRINLTTHHTMSSGLSDQFLLVDPVSYFSFQPILHNWCNKKEENVLSKNALNTFYLRLYGVRHMVLSTTQIVREETHCRHMGYSFRLTARVLLYAPSHRQDNTYHGLCYTSHGALAGTRNSSIGPPHEGSMRRPIAPWANALPLSYVPLP